MDFIISPYEYGEEQYVANLHKKLYSEEYAWNTSFTDYGICRKSYMEYEW